MTKGYSSLLVNFVSYIIISRTTGKGVEKKLMTTKINSNQYSLENKCVAFYKKLYFLRKWSYLSLVCEVILCHVACSHAFYTCKSAILSTWLLLQRSRGAWLHCRGRSSMLLGTPASSIWSALNAAWQFQYVAKVHGIFQRGGNI